MFIKSKRWQQNCSYLVELLSVEMDWKRKTGLRRQIAVGEKDDILQLRDVRKICDWLTSRSLFLIGPLPSHNLHCWKNLLLIDCPSS